MRAKAEQEECREEPVFEAGRPLMNWFKNTFCPHPPWSGCQLSPPLRKSQTYIRTLISVQDCNSGMPTGNSWKGAHRATGTGYSKAGGLTAAVWPSLISSSGLASVHLASSFL
jgi:hypothetical protein